MTTSLTAPASVRSSNRLARFAPMLDQVANPLGFEAGDANVSRYVGNSPTNTTDPSGLAEWRLDISGHGGPHLQYGDERWNAVTLEPLEHKGHTPKPLTARQLEELRDCNLWDRMIKNVDNTNLERVIRETLSDEIQEQIRKGGARSLKKTVAKRIAKEVLRRSPLVIVFLLLDAKDVYADAKSKGLDYAVCNQVVPIGLVEELTEMALERFTKAFDKRRYGLRVKMLMRTGLSEEKAREQAWDYMLESEKANLMPESE